MAYSLYDASVPVLLNTLRNLAALLDKAEAHAKTSGVNVESYLDGRIAPDMHPLTRQIQMASDAAKGGAGRLAADTPPSYVDDEKTWAEVKARVAKTISYIETIKPEQLADGEGRTIELPLPGRTVTFTAADFLSRFVLPNFYFHVVTAYAILRHQGVPLGKMDYLAGGAPIQV